MQADEWGAVQVMTGTEPDVLRRMRGIPGLQALAPMERITQMRGHKLQERLRPLLPGYVLLHWHRDAAAYYQVRATPGVIRFLGGGCPESIPEEQMRVLLALARHCEAGKPAPAIQTDGRTQISGGPLHELQPSIIRVNRRAGRAALEIRLGNQTHTVTVAVKLDRQPKKPDGGGG